MRRQLPIGIALVVGIVLGAGLLAGPVPDTPGSGGQGGPDPTDVELASSLQPFGACDELLTYFQTEALEIVGPWGLHGGPVYYADDAVTAEAGASSDAAGAPAPARDSGQVAGEDFSGTNVQEEGVDEPDIVKTDGELVVTAIDGQLTIVDLRNPDEVAGMLRLGGWDHQLFLHGDMVLALGGADHGVGGPAMGVPSSDVIGPGHYGTGVSVLSVIDITDPSDPEVTAELTLDGTYHSARLIDGTARIVLSSQPTGLEFTHPAGGGLRAEREATRENRQVIRESTIENWLPYYILEEGGDTSEGVLLDCDAVSRPAEFSGLGLVSVLTVDVDGTLTPDGSTAIVAAGETVYASAESLYVTTNRWFDPESQRPDRAADESYSTEIHAFDISDPSTARYLASGTVRGHVLNQFSLSEHDGHLRVATTDGTPWAGAQEASESFVTVFAEQGGELVRVGQVGELGRGERIYSVRFLGDVGYVVTFRETDPLYTVDLSDPTSPRTTGELKIRGYSAYLHPIDDGLLLGVGQEATNRGRTLGTQVSLFDVSDPDDPRRISHAVQEDAHSEAEWDHHAFLYWPATGLAVIPIERYDVRGRARPEDHFVGAWALQVGGDTVQDVGELSQPTTGRDPWASGIRRALVVGDSLITVSYRGLMLSDLETLEQESFVRF